MSGALSHDLPALKTSGNRIVDCVSGTAVKLKGVVRSGLEYSGVADSLASAGITENEIEEIVGKWGANIIRLPFNQDWALARPVSQDSPGYDPSPYLRAVDFVIDKAAARGAYTLLDLQWLDAKVPRGLNQDLSANYVPALPNLDSIDLWRQLAARYEGESAVLYDVFNEPHDAYPNDPNPLLGMRGDGTTLELKSRRVTMKEWQPWATRLIKAVRSENSDALIFVSGVNWGFDLRGFPLPEIANVVYSTHVYSNKGSNWDSAFGDLSKQYPVFASEWGIGDGEMDWGQELVEYFDRHDIGWTAWSWTDVPNLVERLSPNYQPTAFGQLVRSLLNS